MPTTAPIASLSGAKRGLKRRRIRQCRRTRRIASLSGAKRGLKPYREERRAPQPHRFALRSEARIETNTDAFGSSSSLHRFALRSEARIETSVLKP